MTSIINRVGEKMKCSICGNEIEKKYDKAGKMYWDKGENAEPVNSGRCCSKCNYEIVIPRRMSDMGV